VLGHIAARRPALPDSCGRVDRRQRQLADSAGSMVIQAVGIRRVSSPDNPPASQAPPARPPGQAAKDACLCPMCASTLRHPQVLKGALLSQHDPYGINAEAACQARQHARAEEARRQELLRQQFETAQQELRLAAIQREKDDLRARFTSWVLKHDIPPDRIITEKVKRFTRVRHRAWHIITMRVSPDYGSGASYPIEETYKVTKYLCEDGQVRNEAGQPEQTYVHEMRNAIVELVNKYGIPFD
jgi:hypothetical protein